MNYLLSIFICLLLGVNSYGNELQVITESGRQGIVDEKGTLIIPPIYQKLGWSNGTNEVMSQTIGYYERGKWGLIDIKNQKISSVRYTLLEPSTDDLFEAGITGRFSNRIFRGLIDRKGEVIVDFRYFTIDAIGDHLLIVSEYKDGALSYGIRSTRNDLVLSASYNDLKRCRDILVASNQSNKVMPFTLQGEPILQKWVDNVRAIENGYELVNGGYIGHLSEDLSQVQFPEYKSYRSDGLVEFPIWNVAKLLDTDSSLEVKCDSITYDQSSELLIAHVNRSAHILGASDQLFKNQSHELKCIQSGFIITRDRNNGSWGIYKTNGTPVALDFDSVVVDSSYFYTLQRDRWDIYNLFGRKINKYAYKEIGFSMSKNIPVKRTDYWGWIDFQGDVLVNYRFEEVIPSRLPLQYIAKNYGKWGVASLLDEWIILPEYDGVFSYGNMYVCLKGGAQYILSSSGEELYRFAHDLRINDYLILEEGELLGALTKEGLYIYPRYIDIHLIGSGHYVLKTKESLELIDSKGRTILKGDENVREVLSFSEGLFHIIKDGRHGFVDDEGKLRIANRYDSAQYFQEGLAPVNILQKWGFIDKNEILVIQPFYQFSSVFKNGLAIVQVDNNYGIITKKGDEIVATKWKSIKRLPTNNYLLTDWDERVGLINESGKFMLRPKYSEILDTPSSLVIAQLGGQMGVIDYSGYTVVPFEYRDIKILGDYLLLRKD